MLAVRFAVMIFLALPMSTAVFTPTRAAAGEVTCDQKAANQYRTRGDDLYDRARYNAAGDAYAAAARLLRGCTMPDAALLAGTSLALAGGAYGTGGKTYLGATQLRRAQQIFTAIIAQYPRQAPEARHDLLPVQASLDVIDSQSM